MLRINHRRGRRTLLIVLCAVVSLLVGSVGVTTAYAKGGGGTAKPPKGTVSPWNVPTLGDPVFSVSPLDIHGFDITGFVQDAKVSSANCPALDPSRWGGSVTVNNTTVTIPCNLIVQMPANTFTWADFVNGTPGGPTLAVSLKDSAFPSFEMRLVGNIVGGPASPNKLNSEYIAGLAYASQQSVNSGSGKITRIDYTTGNLYVDASNGQETAVQINDPNGRFGRAQSPDARFSVDDQNPTVHAGTGYPMCVPRTDPTVQDDPLCPQQNRPARKVTVVNGANVPAVASCRLFGNAGVAIPGSGELTQSAAGDYCSQYVMKSTTDATRTATDADPRQQAPFEVGDFVNYQGTLVHGAAGTGDYLSAHTVEANLGIYTQPGTQPSYVSIGEFGVGTADPSATAVSGVAQETQDRIFLESNTTDVKTPVDIYMTDVNADGSVRNRWITPFEMTGENQLGAPSGGITTQNTGAQPQRARLRATKAPVGLLSQPSRNIRVAQRSLCLPTPLDPAATTVNQAALDSCLNNAPRVANGLQAGEYTAPTFEFIFPENVKPGDQIVPNDLWHLPFLRSDVQTPPTGVAVGPADPGPLMPTPW